MRSLFFLLLISIFSVNCSTPPAVKDSNVATNSVAANQPTSNAETRTESNAAGNQGSLLKNPNAFGLTPEKKLGTANVAPIQAKTLSNPAPDNSTIVSTMNSRGVPIETRTFKNNPLLSKIEKVLEDVKNPQVNVYLKNGKVVNLPSGALADPSTASANDILTAAGVTPKSAAPQNDAKSKNEKKIGN